MNTKIDPEYQFLKQTKPFCDLPDDIIRKTTANLTLQHFKQKEILFHQGSSNFQDVLIVEKGSLEFYYDIDGQKKSSGFLRRGDVCGGIALLKNRGVATRSIVATGGAACYRLAGETFLELCKDFDGFQNFFERIYKGLLRVEDLPFFNQSVEKFYHLNPVKCDVDSSIQDAARLMRREKCGSIFIQDKDRHYVGIVTDNDLRNKVVARGRDVKTAVGDIMSRPLKTVSSDIQIFEALMTMMNANIKHLGVTDQKQDVVGVVTNQDLLFAQGQSPFFLIREIQKAESFAAIKGIHHRLPNIIQTIIHSGAKSRNINRMITTISDAILRKIITFAIKELGPPPVDFVFMILGSEGRKEQTLKTDQDNAIIYADVPKTDQNRIARYFLDLGARICDWLNAAGYVYCVGGIMAKNERWCQPISMWKQDFSHWIHTATGEALLQASIFFDFRGAYGNLDMIIELRNFLFSVLKGWAGFYRHMTENALCFKPPLGFFRNFVVESKGKHRNKFDVKHAMQPVVDFARILALKHQIAATNTQERLAQLREQGVINRAEYEELDQAYSFLMQQRFLSQISDILNQKVTPSNYINPKSLSSLDQTLLKAIFKKIEKFQSKLEFEFTSLP